MKSTLVRISTMVSAFVVLFALQVTTQASNKTNAYNFKRPQVRTAVLRNLNNEFVKSEWRTNYFGTIEFFNAKLNPIEFIDGKFVRSNQVRIDAGGEYLFGQNRINLNSPKRIYLRRDATVTFANQNVFGANNRRNIDLTANPFNPDAKWTAPKAFMGINQSVNTF